jgi:hypothetical protein
MRSQADRRLIPSCFEASKLGVALILLTAIIVTLQGVSRATEATSLLDLRIQQPLRWTDSCEADLGTRYQAHVDSIYQSALLRLSVDVTNRSAEAMYLPVKYLRVELQAIRTQTLALEGEEHVWLPLYGVVGDIAAPDWLAEALKPGETRHHDICFFNSTSVIDLQIPEGRRIPLGGKFRISAKYFASRELWQQYKNASVRDGVTEGRGGTSGPRVVDFETEIPCFGASCRVGCNTPPLILAGETAGTMDISAKSEKGMAINKQVARKFPGCFEDGGRP